MLKWNNLTVKCQNEALSTLTIESKHIVSRAQALRLSMTGDNRKWKELTQVLVKFDETERKYLFMLHLT